MANRIMLNETSYHGAGAIKEIATEAKARAFKKAFVCSDPDLIKFGVTKKVTDILDENGQVKTRRWYDSEGKAYRDVDMTDHGNPKQHPEVPHEHTWDWSSGGPIRK